MQIYNTYVDFWIFLTAFPLILNITFGILAYRNLRMMKNANQLQGADHQITLMVLAQVALLLFGLLPFTLFQIYVLATQNMVRNQEQKDQIAFLNNFFGFVAAFEFGVSRLLLLLFLHHFYQIYVLFI
jgi:hypothetical protein